jgi:hypothetical protein
VKSSVYSRWDGSQDEFRLDAERALDALSNLMMEGLDASSALEWMRQHGFELPGLDMRVMGLSELLEELRDEIRALEQRYHLDRATDELRKRFEAALDREQGALRERHGFESARMNDFQQRRHADAQNLSDAIERFRDWSFEDEEAGDETRELLEELDRLRELERFQRERGERFRGPEAADYETAQEIRERIEALEQLGRDLAEGNLEQISAEQLRELLGENAVRSLLWIRDLESTLERAGYLRGGDPQLTPRAIRRIGAHALAEVYAALRRDRPGGHESDTRGAALPRPDETTP